MKNKWIFLGISILIISFLFSCKAKTPLKEHTHSFQEAWCNDESYHWKECECGKKNNEEGHFFDEWIFVTSPTSTTKGLKKRICNICKYEEIEEIPVLTHEHIYTTQVVEPTCEEQGYTLHICDCKDSYKDAYTDPLHHDYEIKWEWNGYIESKAIFICKHNPSHKVELNGEIDSEIIKNPTCEEEGLKEYSATILFDNKEYKDKKEEVLSSLGHEYEASFLWTGYTQVFVTLICKHDSSHKVELNGEISSEIIKTPTCEEEGLKEYRTIVIYNNEEYKDKKEEILSSLGHEYKEEIIAPTCEEDGYTLHTCQKCMNAYKDNFIDELGHEYKVEWGWRDFEASATFICKNDATHKEIREATITNEIKKEPKCLEPGLKEYTATVLFNDEEYKDKKEEILSSLGHEYKEEIIAPTCEEDGYTLHTCSRCKDSYKNTYTNSIGHTYKEIIIQPTCEEKGYTLYTCINCEDTYRDQYVNPIGHDYDYEWVWTGYTSAKILFTCKRDSNHKDFMLGTITNKVVQEATSTEEGLAEYKARVFFEGQVYEDMVTQIIPIVDNENPTVDGLIEGCVYLNSSSLEVIMRDNGQLASCKIEKKSENDYIEYHVENDISNNIYTFIFEEGIYKVNLSDVSGNILDFEVITDFIAPTIHQEFMDATTEKIENDLYILGPSRFIFEDETKIKEVYILKNQKDKCFFDDSILKAFYNIDSEGIYDIYIIDMAGNETQQRIIYDGISYILEKQKTSFSYSGVEFDLTFSEFYCFSGEYLLRIESDNGVDTYTYTQNLVDGKMNLVFNVPYSEINDNYTNIVFYARSKMHPEIETEIGNFSYSINEQVAYEDAHEYPKGLEYYEKTSENDQFVYRYNLNNPTQCALVRCKEITAKEIIIPKSIDGKEIVRIEKFAFSNMNSLETIRIPNGIKNIGACAFLDDENLKTVYFPKTLEGIEDSAFKNCNLLEEVYFNGNIEDWCNVNFSNATLSSSIYSNPMYYAEAFYYKNDSDIYVELISFILPESIKEIGNFQFIGFNHLQNVVIQQDITEIKCGAFMNCNQLEAISFKNIEKLYPLAFYNCSSLLEIELPSGISELGLSAFYNCNQMEKITFGALDVIRKNAFYKCNQLAKVYFSATIEDWCNIQFRDDSIGLSTPMYYADEFYMLDEDDQYALVTKIEIPSTITKIGIFQFYGFKNVKEFIFPISVEEIFSGALNGCSNLEALTLPFIGDCKKDITDTYQYPLGYIFGKNSYENGTIITQIYKEVSLTETAFCIPSGLKQIKVLGKNIFGGAFYGCNMIEEVMLSSQLQSIGKDAFYGCNHLTKVYYNGTIEDWCQIEFENEYSNPMVFASEFYLSNTELTEIVISGDKVGKYQFYGFNHVTSIKISSSVTIIGAYAFTGCTSATIYCEVTEANPGWDLNWNSSNLPVYWNV